MKKSDELKKERRGLFEQQEALVKTAQKDKRSFTEDEARQFDEIDEQIKGFDEEIRRAERYEENLKRQASSGEGESQYRKGGEEEEMGKLKKRFSLHKAILSQTRNGKLDGVEAEIHQETLKRASAAGVSITGFALPTDFRNWNTEHRADGQTVTQDSGNYGANLVAKEQQGVIEFLRPNPVVRQLGARYMTDLVGNLEFPVNNGGIAATWAGEVSAAAASKNAYGLKEMKPKRLVSRVPVSLQNLMQSSIDLERYTIEEINAVVANALDLAAINGSGTGNVPMGILNDTNVNTIAAGTNGAAPSWANIVGAETKVFIENANSAKMAWAINPPTRGKLKTTKHEAGDLNYLMNWADSTINGYPTVTSNLLPSDLDKGTSLDVCSAAIFGDFSQLIVGQWGFYDLTVDEVSKKSEGNIEIILNMFADVLVRQPKAFTVIKDWLTV